MLGSVSQMTNLYTFIWDELATSKGYNAELSSNIYIFIPLVCASRNMDVVPGIFMSPDKVYWHDPTGCVDRMRETTHQNISTSKTGYPPCMTLACIYPGLHNFFVNDCGVLEVPPFGRYLEILLQLSSSTKPSQAAHEIFQVFLKWADDLKSGSVNSEEILHLKENLLKSEYTVLPTVQDKWVSLHPHFGLVCWPDDEELMEQYLQFDDVCILQFGELTAIEKEMLSGKVAALMKKIGISSLTEVVYREAIFYGRADSTEEALVNWVLPYAQRYIYKLHPDIYLHLKQFGFEKLTQLKIIAVEKLFYKNSLKGHHCASEKRFECSCLLQGNILYTTGTADSHTIFSELSRFFFHGTPELHLANFLHMITIMAESGSTKEQIESFVLNSQKVPELPAGEELWSLSGLLKPYEEVWPASTISDGDSSVKGYTTTLISQESGAAEDRQPPIAPDLDLGLACASTLTQRERLCLEAIDDEQSYKTGRLGESIAYRYFTEKLGSAAVKWVNEESETGLPYDLIIGKAANREYIEVKTTTSASKDWFLISANEWQCAAKKRGSFSIARVILSSPTDARIIVLKNPLKLCQENALQLALLMSHSAETSTA